MLDYNIFKTIVQYTPLVSMDLLVVNSEGKLLLGWRNNSPAKNTWFVPGGRIAKDETTHQAFKRISKTELGKEIDISDCKFLGVYEHIYPLDNFSESNDFGTHYIVLGFRIDTEIDCTDLPPAQHKRYRWATMSEVMQDTDVHQNVKNYFNGYSLF